MRQRVGIGLADNQAGIIIRGRSFSGDQRSKACQVKLSKVFNKSIKALPLNPEQTHRQTPSS